MKKWTTIAIRSNIYRSRPEILIKWCFQKIFMKMKAEILLSKGIVIIKTISPCYLFLYQSLKLSSHQSWQQRIPSQRRSHISPFRFLVQAISALDCQKIRLIARPLTQNRQILMPTILPKIAMIK